MAQIIVELLNIGIIGLKELEWKVKYSRFGFLRKYGSEVVGIGGILFFTYILAAIIYAFVEVTPQLQLPISHFFKNLHAIFNGGTVYLFIPKHELVPTIDLKKLLSIYVCLFVVIVSFTFLRKERNVIKEIDVFHNVLRFVLNNAKLGNRQVGILSGFLVVMIIVSYYILPYGFFINNVGYIIIFWTSIAIAMMIYREAKDETIKAKKFILVIFITPILIISVLKNTQIDYNQPITLIILITTIYFAIDNIINIYLDFRKDIYDGKSLLFLINSFDEEDYNNLWEKIKYNKPSKAEENIDEIIIYCLTAFFKTNRDIEASKEYLRFCLKISPQNNVVLYCYSIVFLEECPDDVYDLLNEIERLQEQNKNLEICFYDVKFLKVDALLNMKKVNYKKIIEILENEKMLQDDYRYILARSYIQTQKMSKAKEILVRLYYKAKHLEDVPYWQAFIELNEEVANLELVEQYIKTAENYNIDCGELREILSSKKGRQALINYT